MQEVRRYVSYVRVSTQQQGRSGLGLEAQEHAVGAYLAVHGGDLLKTFTEIETAKGVNALDKRPELRAALDLCRKEGATLLIAKLDRLARNCAFVSGLLEAGCEFVAADMPQASKTMIQIYAAMSEWERDQISARTKAALAAAKARGVQLGTKGRENLAHTNQQRAQDADAFAGRLREQIAAYRQLGYSQRRMVEALNRIGITAPRGGLWSLKQVQLLLRRLDCTPA